MLTWNSGNNYSGENFMAKKTLKDKISKSDINVDITKLPSENKTEVPVVLKDIEEKPENEEIIPVEKENDYEKIVTDLELEKEKNKIAANNATEVIKEAETYIQTAENILSSYDYSALTPEKIENVEEVLK